MFLFSILLLSSSASLKFALILLPEAISCWEKVPTPSLVHVPDVGLLASVLSLVLVDEVHDEEPETIIKIAFTHHTLNGIFQKLHLKIFRFVLFIVTLLTPFHY